MATPPLSARLDRNDTTILVRLTGEVDVSTAPVLDKALHDATAAPPLPARVVADLTGVPFMDSFGLTVLLAAMHRLREAGIGFGVVVPQDAAPRRVIELVGLTATLEVTDTEG